MSRLILLSVSVAIVSAVVLPAQTISNPTYNVAVFAGAGLIPGVPANSVPLDGPFGLAEDSKGNVYIAESNAGLIWQVRPDGTKQIYAGTGRVADGPSGYPALSTDLLYPTTLLWDGNGGLYFSDDKTCKIRRVRADQTIEDIAGSGNCASTGRFGGFGGGGGGGGLAIGTTLYPIGGMAIDSQNRLLFTEPGNHVVRLIDTNGMLLDIAGAEGAAGFSGDTAYATSAQLYNPTGIATDGAGNLYIADYNNCRIRVVDNTGIINTLVGAKTCATATASYSGSASTPLERTGALAYDPSTNSLLIAMPRVYRIVRFDMNAQRVTSYLGNGKLGVAAPTTPTGTPINDATAILATPDLGILVSAASSYQVLQYQSGTLQIFAGQWPSLPTGVTTSTVQLMRPSAVLPNADGTAFIADSGAGRILQAATDGTLLQVAGVTYPLGFQVGDGGPARSASLSTPRRMARRSNGDLYFIDSFGIRVLTADGKVTTIRDASNSPVSLAFNSQDRLLVSEAAQHRIISVFPDYPVLYSVIAGTTGKAGYGGDGTNANGSFLNTPGDIALDTNGNLYIVDSGNNRIRRVGTDGNISTVAGSGLPFSYADIRGQAALNAGLGGLSGIAVDQAGNLYFGESDRLDVVTPDGNLQVVTGYVFQADSGAVTYLDGPINGIDGLSVGPDGTLYAAIRNQGRILAITKK